MKNVILTSIAFAALVFNGGCEPDGGAAGPSSKGKIPPGIERGFGPARIQVMGLTEIVSSATGGDAELSIYVDILDAYDSRIKTPGVFRFELYRFAPRSSDPRGERLKHWRDIDLTDPDVNNSYWQDYLRTYRFNLDLDFKTGRIDAFIVEVSLITPQGKHLTEKHKLERRR